MKQVIIYTDGSCLRNPGPGGWAAILQLANTQHRREICGGCRLTTNNRMEIMAALQALKALKEPCEVELHSDSQYLCNALEKGWLMSWQKKAWRKSDGKPVLNSDLWRQLAPLVRQHRVSLHWLRGHTGCPENERCDELAKSRANGPDLPADEVYEKLSAEER